MASVSCVFFALGGMSLLLSLINVGLITMFQLGFRHALLIKVSIVALQPRIIDMAGRPKLEVEVKRFCCTRKVRLKSLFPFLKSCRHPHFWKRRKKYYSGKWIRTNTHSKPWCICIKEALVIFQKWLLNGFHCRLMVGKSGKSRVGR